MPAQINTIGNTSTIERELTLPDDCLSLEGTKYKIRPYQVEGVNYLRNNKRRWLTDKPGLGKTIQAVLAAKPPVLIFAPTYLTHQWWRVLKEVVEPNGQTIALCDGPKAKRMEALSAHADWTICNTEMLRDYGFRNDVCTLIIDEAHHIRGHESQQSLGAVKLANIAEYVFLLTATPVYNKPDDLYAQIRLLDRDRFHSYWKFCQDYTIQIQAPFGPKVIKAQPRLRQVFESYNLGRTYQDVQMELPELVEDVIIIDPPDDFKKVYKTLKELYYIPGQEVYDNALQVLQELRKLTGPQKLKTLASLVADTELTSGSIIYSWYKNTAHAIGELLDIPVVDGDMPPKQRADVVKNNSCVSATISAAAEGIDASHMHTVVFFELDYVPGRLYQALSRVRRHGGHDVVHVIYLLVKNTVDEVLHNVDTERTRTINAIVRECLT